MKRFSVLAVLALASVAVAQDYSLYNSGYPTGSELSYVVPGVEGGGSALVYNDRPAGHGGITTAGMELGAAARGYTITFTNNSGGFAGLLPSASWDLVMSGHHNYANPQPWEAGLSTYVSGGGATVLEDWRTPAVGGHPAALATAAGFPGSPALPENYTSASVVTGSRLAGAGLSGTIPLGNSGWGRFSNSVTGGGPSELTSSAGTSAGRANAGKTAFWSGLNDDTIGWTTTGTWNPALATDLYAAMINNVPEPATLALLGLGALGILRRRR